MFKVTTDFPYCYDSADYKQPCGAAHDNSTNNEFIERTLLLFRKQINVVDLGCAGGQMIVDFHNSGHNAIGLDGSGYPKESQPNWQQYPDIFFTADASKPFQILLNNEPYQADLITAWEFLEHISEEDLPTLFSNIKELMVDTASLFINSVAFFESGEYHRNVKDRAWWRNTFEQNGFLILDKLEDLFILGDRNTNQNWHFVRHHNNGYGFHGTRGGNFILQLK